MKTLLFSAIAASSNKYLILLGLSKQERAIMADADNIQEAQRYHLDIPVKNEPSGLKGSNSLDWGMKSQLKFF